MSNQAFQQRCSHLPPSLSTDSSKAFDTVSHNILLKKLAAHGLDWRMLHWVRNWLNSQAQRVVPDLWSCTGTVWDRNNIPHSSP